MSTTYFGMPIADGNGSLERISTRAFEQLRRLVQSQSGIRLPDSKRELVCARLARRVRALQLPNYDDYYHLLLCEDRDGVELQQLINCISTTKTDFFREAHHFDFLRTEAFPSWRLHAVQPASRRLRLWSAACSKGHEPYSLAMALLEHFGLLSAWDVRILATDVNTDVLRTAIAGEYSLDETGNLDERMRERWMLKGTGSAQGSCRVRDEVKRLVTFRPLNLTTPPWPMAGSFDAIFCRNVLIYFDEQTQREVIRSLVRKLSPSGYLFLGHSEHRVSLSEHLESVGRTVYRRRNT